ncbi:MAG TPA: NAD(P)-dependent oxidoreductase [Solirubrobacterales bacterium]|jgi:nucleoside-diphosphate-sugar epimerase|nr:NAD(P)-dependent oxidoreductase [Solirubrobacterales bacterium]
MKVFVAGATGALGKQLVPRLVERGHEVTGMTRTDSKRALLEELGARPVVADALDADAVGEAVGTAEPDVVVHQLTSIRSFDPRNVDRSFAETNRLRTEGTDVLLAAARAAGAGRFVAQSFTSWPYKQVGGPVKTEEDPLDDSPPASISETLAAIKHVERVVIEADGIDGVVLRYGGFYGPGTSLASGGEQFEAIRERKFPVVGDGAGVWSFIEIRDAADATVAAIERGEPGIYNIVDDDPAPVSEWLPAAAKAVGAKPPRRFPRWLARILAGEAMTSMMTETRGASNEKAKRELGWTPAHPSWRQGFAAAAGSS